MSKRNRTLTQKRLKELLHYDPVSGVFTRLTDNRRGSRVGDIAGSHHHDGYIYIYVDGANYAAHRLAWLYVHGRWPFVDVDHKHGKEAGNGIENLREATEKLNAQNERNARISSKSGLLGAYWSKSHKGWCAGITVARRKKWLGVFGTPEEAHAAYVEAKRKLHDGCMI
jgi:hypothetical protein